MWLVEGAEAVLPGWEASAAATLGSGGLLELLGTCCPASEAAASASSSFLDGHAYDWFVWRCGHGQAGKSVFGACSLVGARSGAAAGAALLILSQPLNVEVPCTWPVTAA